MIGILALTPEGNVNYEYALVLAIASWITSL